MASLLKLDTISTLTLSNCLSLPCHLLGVWWWASMLPRLFQFHLRSTLSNFIFLCSTSDLSFCIANLIKRFSLKHVTTWKHVKILEDMFFYLSGTLMFILSFCNHCWMFLRSKPILRRRKIATRMLLCKRSQFLILIVSKFNLHNFKYWMWVSGQSLIINIPLFDVKIGCLQGRGQFLFLPVRNFSLACFWVFCF